MILFFCCLYKPLLYGVLRLAREGWFIGPKIPDLFFSQQEWFWAAIGTTLIAVAATCVSSSLLLGLISFFFNVAMLVFCKSHKRRMYEKEYPKNSPQLNSCSNFSIWKILFISAAQYLSSLHFYFWALCMGNVPVFQVLLCLSTLYISKMCVCVHELKHEVCNTYEKANRINLIWFLLFK